MCLTNYGASKAVNLCIVELVRGEIHKIFGTKKRQLF